MVYVWYVEYGDTAHNIDPSAVYEAVLAEVKSRDPDAYIVEVRQFKYQIAFYVNHPTITVAKLRAGTSLITGLGIFLLLLAISAVLTGAGFVISAWTGYIRETHTYVERDPETGEEVTIVGYDSYRAWLITHYPEQAEYLASVGASNWWNGVSNIIWIIAILIGAAIVVPLITKLIPGKEGG